MCVCVCVCVWRERKRERERDIMIEFLTATIALTPGFTMRWFSVIYRTLVGVLSLCRDVFGVFYIPNRMG